MEKKQSPKRTLWLVMSAIILGVAFGSFLHVNDYSWKESLLVTLGIGGTLFLNALTLVVAPLVTASIISGMARMGSEKKMGSLGFKTFGFYLGTSLAAIVIGVVLVHIIQPGASDLKAYLVENHTGNVKHFIDNHSHPESFSSDIRSAVEGLIPANILDAISHNHMLGIIFFSLIFGYSISKIPEENGTSLIRFFRGLFLTMLKFTQYIMKALPLGVFCLVAPEFAKTGIRALEPVMLFVVTVLVALSVYSFIFLPLLLKYVGKVNPLWHVKAVMPSLFTAFSTSSSSATLPVTMECVEKRARVSNQITSLVVPLGSSINMAGSGLYESVAALFIAQVYGLEIGIFQQILVIFLALLTSIGIAGIPSASLVVVVIVLKTLGLPIEAVGLVVAVDRLLDMCRTVVNVFSDGCCAVLIARSEGEKKVLATDPSLIAEEV